MGFSFERTQNPGTTNEKSLTVHKLGMSGFIVGPLMLVICIVASFLLVSGANADKNLMQNGVRVEGTVVDVRYDMRNNRNNNSNNNSNKSKKITIVEYVAEDGVKRTTSHSEKTSSSTSSSSKSIAGMIGEKKVVYYDSSDPSKVVVEGWERDKSMGLIFIGFIALFSIFMIVKSGLELRKKRSGDTDTTE